jgi:putative ABC transport system substrate-binding protein
MKLLWLVIFFLLGSFHVAEAQQPGKVPRIGYLSLRQGIEPREEAFQKGLRELGYVEGKNIVIEWRFAQGRASLLPQLAAELVHLKPDVIVAAGTQAVRTVKQITSTIPVVIGQVGDPVKLGFVASLARPGGNITGFSTISSRLAGKWLELLKEAFPQIARVAFVRDARNPGTVEALKELEAAARAMGVQVQDLGLRRADELEKTMQAARNWRAEGLIVMTAGVFITRRDRERFAKLEIKSRLPAMHSAPEIVQVGGLMSYFTDVPEQFRRAATYVDKILKGSNTAELPVEQPAKFQFIINLKTAKQSGLTIPPNVLARADRVIK